jgi:uncharacterized membrane protein
MALGKDTNRPTPDGSAGSAASSAAITAWHRQGCHGHLAAVALQTIVLAALNLWLAVLGLRAFGPFERAASGVGGPWAGSLTLVAIAAIVVLIAYLLLMMRGKAGRAEAGRPEKGAPGDGKEASFEFTAWRFHSCRGQLTGALIQSIVLLGLGTSLVLFGIRTLGIYQGQSSQFSNRGLLGFMLMAIAAALVLLLWFLQGNLRRMNTLRREISRLRSAIDPFVGLRLR